MIPFPNKKYQIIYADPPWVFKNYSDEWHKKCKDSKWVGKHYNTMTIEQLKRIEIPCDKNSVLFMWATFPQLKTAIELGEAWGFTYKTNAFTWVKKNKKADSYFIGMGYYTRANAELCLLFTKGKPLPRQSKSVRQICDARIERHSKKPDEIRERIVELFGDVPRIELFARQKTEGWDVWGNEV